nr:unnamed protein product [uncultured bacterium]
MSSSTIATTFRIEKDKIDKIDSLAATTKRSRNWILNEAVTNYISYNNYFLNEVEKGLQDANNKNFATPEEVDNIFKKYGAR